MTATHLLRFALIMLVLWIVLLIGSCRQPGQASQLKLYDLKTQQTLSGTQSVAALKGKRLVLVGEQHTNAAHHRAQLQVIRTLFEQSVVLSIGLEMFSKDRQAALDSWTSGEMDERDFEKIYLEDWNFAWALYREIFVYARDKRIPLVGLNVSREITSQVARQGFASLSADQRGELAGVTCNVTRAYRDFIRKAFGAHGHGHMNFIHFCEAQLVWDTAMAINAINQLKQHPDQTMVLLAGSGHARKMGIPYQVTSRLPISTSVLLPHTPGIFSPATLNAAEADFIIEVNRD